MRSSNASSHAPKQRYVGLLMKRAMKYSTYWYDLDSDHVYLKRIKKYIEKHKDEPEYLNAHRSKINSDTILTWACANGYVEHLEQLLQCQGIDINAKNALGRPALILASHRNGDGDKSEKLIDLLLAYPGIDINQRETKRTRGTALTHSLANLNKNLTMKILRHGGHDAESLQDAFKIAVKNGSADIVAAILENPNINVHAEICIQKGRDEEQGRCITVLQYAAKMGYVAIVKSILNHPKSQYAANHEAVKNSILDATSKHNTSMLIAFIEKNLDNGVELFTWAAKHHQDILHALLAMPTFNGNSMLLDGHNHLTWAIANDEINLAEQLLNHPAVIDVNAHTLNGDTALTIAAESDLHTCDLLLARPGIEVNAQNNVGDTALIKAAACGFTLTLQSLLKAPSIDVNLSNGDGVTALIAACKFGEQECIGSLLAHPDLKINLVDHSGRTALMNAVLSCKAENVKLLLMRSDIDINRQDNTGKTALMYAAQLGLTSVVKMLAAHDASNINTQDNNGDTALLLAARSHDNAIIIETLFDYGANANIKNTRSYTALMAAKKAAHKGICPLLKNPPIHPDYQVAPPYAPAVYHAPSAPPMETPAFETSKPSSPHLGLFAQQPTREPSPKITTDTKSTLRNSI